MAPDRHGPPQFPRTHGVSDGDGRPGGTPTWFSRAFPAPTGEPVAAPHCFAVPAEGWQDGTVRVTLAADGRDDVAQVAHIATAPVTPHAVTSHTGR